MSSDEQAIRQRAIGFLARREHSRKELIRKLGGGESSEAAIEAVVDGLAAAGLQSDERFAESFIHHRVARGYGPVRIRQELQERGISGDLIESLLDDTTGDWVERITTVREKKFGAGMPDNYKEQMKQSRFLQYRGFTGEQISRLFRQTD